MTPIFGIFNPTGFLFYTSTQSDWPLFLQKIISLSLSHLVPQILGPKYGLMFHQNVLFNRFKAFCIHLTFNFLCSWPPFSLILNLLDPSFSQNLRSGWILFFGRAELRYWKFDDVQEDDATNTRFMFIMDFRLIDCCWFRFGGHIVKFASFGISCPILELLLQCGFAASFWSCYLIHTI